MKNYFRQILTSFTKNHYSETIRQNFYGWLTDKEHAVEKDKALKEIVYCVSGNPLRLYCCWQPFLLVIW